LKYVLRAAPAALCLCAPAVSAQDLGIDAAVFGARESVTDIALSPSGEKILFVEPGREADETVFVVDLVNDPTPRPLFVANEARARLSGCYWAEEDAIVCNIYAYADVSGFQVGFNRVLGIDPESGKSTMLSARSDYRSYGLMQNGGDLVALDVVGEDGKILMTRQFVKESSVNTRLYNDEEGFGVEMVDPHSGSRRTVERPNRIAIDYIADEAGRVRIMGTRSSTGAGAYDGSQVRYSFRAKGSNDWQPVSVTDDIAGVTTGFRPLAVDSKADVAYGFETVDGYQALSSVSLDGASTHKVLLRRKDVDVDGLVRIGRDRRVIGASYATEKRIVEYFDPDIARFARSIGDALPGRPLISIVDASEDESKLLIIASSDTDPGMVYLYDRTDRQLAELMPVRAPLEGRTMGAMKPVSFPAADGTAIPGYLTLPPGSDGKKLRAIVMPHGGPGARDEWGFDWMVQFFAAQGYAVLQPNFRGSAGYGDAWFGRNGFKAWDVAISDVNSAGKWLIDQGIADADHLSIVGWSYGGYAALQSQVVDPDLYKAVVAIAPVTDLDALKEESRYYRNFSLVREFVGSGPHIDAGSPARHADAFRAPVLLVHGTMDLNVSVSQSQLMKRKLEGAGRKVEYLEFDGLDHSLVHGQARGIMLRRIGEFLDESLPG